MSRTIRVTKRGRYQVLEADGRPARVATAYETREDAERVIAELDRRDRVAAADAARREPFQTALADVLGQPWAREYRLRLQTLFSDVAYAYRCAEAQQRAAVRHAGEISAAGRDGGVVRQGRADEQFARADELQEEYDALQIEYQRRVCAALREHGVPSWAYVTRSDLPDEFPFAPELPEERDSYAAGRRP